MLSVRYITLLSDIILHIVVGICYDLPAGNISISLTQFGQHNLEFAVGFATHASRLYVEEIGQKTWSGGLENIKN